MLKNTIPFFLFLATTSAIAANDISDVEIKGIDNPYVRWVDLTYHADPSQSSSVSGSFYKQVHGRKSMGGHLDMTQYDRLGKVVSQQHVSISPVRIADKRYKATKFNTDVGPIENGGRIELSFNPLPTGQHRAF
ncbi:MAG: hypothetical protein OQK12_08380 [Motiliproteus sp.]|nr:hypothetical protein [Motiliproteus sp.]MCW9054162.1 hypothetical protein [Motiliproteus sp.]